MRKKKKLNNANLEEIILTEANLQNADLKSEKLLPRFLKLSLANSLSNLMVPLSSLINSAFLGHLAQIDYLGGVALNSVLFSLIYRSLKFLHLGTTGLTSQARFDRDTVLLTLLRNGFIALVIGLIILLLQQPLREIGFALLTASPSVKEAAIDYYNVRIWDAPAVLLNFVIIGWFMGQEKGNLILVLSAVGNGGNIILDYLFIILWKYQSAGAGIATAASQYMMLLVGLIFIIKDGCLLRIPAVVGRIFDPNAIKLIFKLNAELFLARLALIVTDSLFTVISASLGNLVLVANTLLLQVVYLVTDFVDGLSFATASLAGSIHRSGDNKKLSFLLKISVLISVSIGIIAGLILILFTKPLFGLLTNHGEVIEQIYHYLFWLIPVIGCWCFSLSLHGYLIGLTQGFIILKSLVNATVIGFIPCAMVAMIFHQDQILWLALLLFLVVRSTVSFYAAKLNK